MPTFLYIGDDERDFPGDGVASSLHVHPGDHVEVDENPNPRYFDPVDGSKAVIKQPAAGSDEE